MTDNKQIEPVFVTGIPEGATLVGKVEDRGAIPFDTSIQGSPERVWHNEMHDEVRGYLIKKAAEEYRTCKTERLFLVEGQRSGADFDVAGIRYHVFADVYKG